MSWLVYRMTNSAFLLGLVGFSSRIPAFFLAPSLGTGHERVLLRHGGISHHRKARKPLPKGGSKVVDRGVIVGEDHRVRVRLPDVVEVVGELHEIAGRNEPAAQ